jgi:hypothetical protein
MKSLLTLSACVRSGALRFASLLMISAAACLAGEQDQPVSLFNGKDLTGWDGSPGWWTVEDGALTSESTPDKPCKKANYLVWTGAQVADFQLDCDFKISGQANSGIQIRSERRPEHDMFGYQADMTGDGKLIGYIYHHQHGLVAERGAQVVLPDGGKRESRPLGDAANLLKHYKPGEWNHYRIVCKGPSITIFLNGVKMCDIVDNHASPQARKGFIGLQMHPGPPMKVQFKNIFLTSFAPVANANQSTQETPKP